MKKQYIAPIVAVDSIFLMIQVMNLTSSTINEEKKGGLIGGVQKRISTMYI